MQEAEVEAAAALAALAKPDLLDHPVTLVLTERMVKMEKRAMLVHQESRHHQDPNHRHRTAQIHAFPRDLLGHLDHLVCCRLDYDE